MSNTTPRAAEAARLAEEAISQMERGNFNLGCTYIDRLRDLASRADSPVGEAAMSAHLSIKGAERVNLSPRAMDLLQRGADAVSEEERQAKAKKIAEIANVPLGASTYPDHNVPHPTPTPSASPSEAQKAVATLIVKREYHDNGQGPRDTEGFVVALAHAHADAEKLPLGTYTLYTHPSAGAGVPQEGRSA